MKTVLVLAILSMLAASFVANPSVAHAASHSPTITRMPVTIDIKVEQGPESVAAAFDAALNARSLDTALAPFANDATVIDPTFISCPTGHYFTSSMATPPPGCPGGGANQGGVGVEYSAVGLGQIRGYLARLAGNNIQVTEIGTYQVAGDNVTWTLAVSVDEYRNLNIAPLVANAKAVVHDEKIRFLALELNGESFIKLQAAEATGSRPQTTILTSGFLIGIVALGLIFPAAAFYYITRVKSLFAAVPRLERPWLLLGAGVGSLFIALLLIAIRDLTGISPGILDIAQNFVVVLTAFFILVAMVAMKRVWTITPSE